MVDAPKCPDCKKNMSQRWYCAHCGYDPMVLRTRVKPIEKPYHCSVCDQPTSKNIDGIPVCVDCFDKGWGRLPSMPLESSMEIVLGGVRAGMSLHQDESEVPPEAPLYISDKDKAAMEAAKEE